MLQFGGKVWPNGVSITIFGGYLRIDGGLIEVFWLAFFANFSSIRTRGPFLDVKEFKLWDGIGKIIFVKDGINSGLFKDAKAILLRCLGSREEFFGIDVHIGV